MKRTPAVGKEWNYMILLLNHLDILWITLSGWYQILQVFLTASHSKNANQLLTIQFLENVVGGKQQRFNTQKTHMIC